MAALSPERIIAGYQSATDAVRARVMKYAQQLWAMSPSLRDADVDRLVSRVVPVVQAGQVNIAMLTNAYIQQIARLEGVEFAGVVDRNVVNYRGTPAGEVYRRPAVEAYTALSKGKQFPDAAAAGAARLLSIVSTDLQQAKNRQMQRSVEGSGFAYTVRVLTGRENCALCVIASTQRYHKSELMPIHPGCDCGQRPMKAGTDPGQVLDQNLLDMTHEAVQAKAGLVDPSDYPNLIVTNEHGELGPTLGWRSDHFTGPNDIH